MTHFIQVVTTTDSKKDAERIATAVIEQRLAACVQINECKSIYRWQGNIEHAAEYFCLMKSRRDLFPDLEEAIRRVHTYEVPEILATEVIQGGAAYLDWLDHELRPRGNKE